MNNIDVVWGGSIKQHPTLAICIGQGAIADDNGIAIGQYAKAGKHAAAFGSNVDAPDHNLVIGKWNLTDVGERLNALEELVEKQRELLEALWYHPGMPGALEAEKSFNQNINK